MQYLSKAYSYYSGINPATLSGAIDVIVIRHVDPDGSVVLSSSPFHVRFGKLQVLRAGEKCVTLRLPNNLPAPHVAPFSMKVGDTGEAFFVIETDEDVPEDLMTSPVVMPAEARVTVTHHEHTTQERPVLNSLTKQPFGETEQLADDVEYLDLNAASRVVKAEQSAESVTSPSSLLNTASSILPSIPFLSRTSSPEPLQAGAVSEGGDHSTVLSRTGSLPNPMDARPGESTELPLRDRRLSEEPEVELPLVNPGEGEGPDVVYGKDVVLDMAGYHTRQPEVDEIESAESVRRRAVIDNFARDLRDALRNEGRPSLAPRLTDPSLRHPGPPVSTGSEDHGGDIALRRSNRATSEPPGDGEPRDAPDTVVDDVWDWGRTDSRRNTLPASDAKSRLKNVDEDPFLFVFEFDGSSYSFELALCETPVMREDVNANPQQDATFLTNRITFQQFIEDPSIVDSPHLVLRYRSEYLTWDSDHEVLYALAMHRRRLTLPSLAELGIGRTPSGYGWSRWWRKSQTSDLPAEPPQAKPTNGASAKHYAKTLRLTSEQLLQLQLKPGPNTVQFSVVSSYSGEAMCSARIFLWEETDQVVISDIDGTITKSDALGHVFAAIGRDWTHPGIAKLYTDIANNGYKMIYLTSRAIGQADSTRDYLRSINQGDYRLPEAPVIMSPDRLMASLHREVIMRKPELFKMACLRDIQRLFGPYAKDAFFAGFGNRITDAMSYRSVGIEAAKIYTIDSTGVVKTELLELAGHRGSYILLNDLVNEVFPPVNSKVKPEFTDFNYWRSSIPTDIALPDLTPPSPALSARSDTSGRLSVLGKIAGLGRRSSRQAILPTTDPNASPRPSSPLIGPAITSDGDSDIGRYSRSSSMPGSFEEEPGGYFPASFAAREHVREDFRNHDDLDEQDNFDDDFLATGEMRNVPF